MRSYHQFCPVAKAAEIFCERWTALIIRDLAAGPMRFVDLQRGVPLASPSLLSSRLKQLEAEGIVTRSSGDRDRVRRYALTEAGREFVPVVLALGAWGQRWSRRELEEHEMDLGLLLWALEKGAHPESFGDRRTVIEFLLPEQPAKRRTWWFLNDPDHCELCLTPPDRNPDLFVRSALRDLIRVWRGDVSLGRALEDAVIEVHGETGLRRAFRNWFGVSRLADVGGAPVRAPNRFRCSSGTDQAAS